MRFIRAIPVALTSAALLLTQGAPSLAANYVETVEVGNSGWWDNAFRQVIGVEKFWDFGERAADGKGDPLYVVLGFGDSFGSGEGAWDGPGTGFGTDFELTVDDLMYHGGTFDNHINRGCHISTRSSFYLNVGNLRERYGKDLVGANFACTGAESMHIVGSNLEACRDQIVNSDWKTSRRQIGGANGAEGKRGLCSSLPGSSRSPGSGIGFTRETDARLMRSGSGQQFYETFNRDDWNDCNSGWAWDRNCLVGLQGIRSPGADRKDFFNYLAAKDFPDPYPNDRYQSQLYYAHEWLMGLSGASARPVIVLGAYVSAGGNDKGFGPAVTKTLDPLETWPILDYEGDDNEVRSGDIEDVAEVRNIMHQPSITYQLEATYRLIELYMRDWNSSQFVPGMSWNVDEVVDPFIAVQEYPDKAMTACNSRGTSWMNNIDRRESQWLDDFLTQPLLRDIRLAIDRLSGAGMRIGSVPLNFEGHGPCEGIGTFDSRRWINTPEDALAAGQNDVSVSPLSIEMSKAAIHPNAAGHQAIFEAMKPMVENFVDGSISRMRSAVSSVPFDFSDSCLKSADDPMATNVEILNVRYDRGATFKGKVYIGKKQLWSRFEPHSNKNQWNADKVIREAIGVNDALTSGLLYGPSDALAVGNKYWADTLPKVSSGSLRLGDGVRAFAAGNDFGHVSRGLFGRPLPTTSNDSGFVRSRRLQPPIVSTWGAQDRPRVGRPADQPTRLGQLRVTVLDGCSTPDYAVVTIEQDGDVFLKSRGVPIGGVPWVYVDPAAGIATDDLWVLTTGRTSSNKGTKEYPADSDIRVVSWPKLIPWHEALDSQPRALLLENELEDRVWNSTGVRDFALCPAQPDYSRLLRGPYTLALTIKNGKEAAEAPAQGRGWYSQPWGAGDRNTEPDTLLGAELFHTQPSLSCLKASTRALEPEQAWAMRCDETSFRRGATFNPCRVEVLFPPVG